MAERAGLDPNGVVRQAGTLDRDRTGRITLSGWKLDSNELPHGDLSNYDFGKKGVPGLTLQQIHGLARGHGPGCTCGIIPE